MGYRQLETSINRASNATRFGGPVFIQNRFSYPWRRFQGIDRIPGYKRIVRLE